MRFEQVNRPHHKGSGVFGHYRGLRNEQQNFLRVQNEKDKSKDQPITFKIEQFPTRKFH